MVVTTSNNKRRQAPGYNKGNDIVDKRITDIYPHPLGLSGQEIFEKSFFPGINSAPDIDDYRPVKTETLQHSTNSDDATNATLIKSAVN